MCKNCEANICSNCKYFQRYYIMGNDGAFKPTALGHCIHYKLAKSLSSKRIQNDDGCDLWQPYELQKLRIQYCMELRLQRICNDISNVLAVLRDIK